MHSNVDLIVITPAEYKVLEVIAGRTYKQISDLLGITEGSVKKHISSLISKSSVSNKTELACLHEKSNHIFVIGNINHREFIYLRRVAR